MNIEIWLNKEDKTLAVVNVVKETDDVIQLSCSIAYDSHYRYIQVVDIVEKPIINKTTKRFNYEQLKTNEDVQTDFMAEISNVFNTNEDDKNENDEKVISFHYVSDITEPISNIYHGYKSLITKDETEKIYVYTNKGVYKSELPKWYGTYLTIAVNPVYAKSDNIEVVSIVKQTLKSILTFIEDVIVYQFDEKHQSRIEQSVINMPKSIRYKGISRLFKTIRRQDDKDIAVYSSNDEDDKYEIQVDLYNTEEIINAFEYAKTFI